MWRGFPITTRASQSRVHGKVMIGVLGEYGEAWVRTEFGRVCG